MVGLAWRPSGVSSADAAAGSRDLVLGQPAKPGTAGQILGGNNFGQVASVETVLRTWSMESVLRRVRAPSACRQFMYRVSYIYISM